MTNTHIAPKFTAEAWAAFWAAPDPSRIGGLLAEDIVGHWPGDPKPVRGRAGLPRQDRRGRRGPAAICGCTLVDSATRRRRQPTGEELIFLHYTGTAADGAVTIRGMDRVRTRDGIVVENVIRYDLSEL